MSPEWKTKILAVDKDTEKGAATFVNLVEEAVDNCDLDTARVLIKTFTTDEDYGVQESVVSALSSAKIQDYQWALLEELPRLVRDAPEWAGVLIEREARFNPEGFLRVLEQMPDETKRLTASILENIDPYYSDYDFQPFLNSLG